MSSLITKRYWCITSSDVPGSGWGASGLSTRWDKHSGLMSGRRAECCANLEVLLARWMRRGTRGYATCAATGKFRSRQLTLRSRGLTARAQQSSGATGERHDRCTDVLFGVFWRDRADLRTGDKPESYSDGIDCISTHPEQACIKRPGAPAEPQSASNRQALPEGSA